MSVPIPKGGGRDAATFLEAHGIPSLQPKPRSSDDSLLRSSPFVYYLQRRLGIVDPLSSSKALRRGSWFHKAAELFMHPSEFQQHGRQHAITERVAELTEIMGARGVTGVDLKARLDEERTDAATAFAWFDAASRLTGPGILSKGFGEWLKNPAFRILGQEVELSDGTSVMTADLLLYSEPDNSVWVLDWKTTDKPPTIRLATVPFEFQTLHYCHITNINMPALIAKHQLPADATFGGMIHVAIQKPSIKLCGEDRDYSEVMHTLKSGPRKGEIEKRKTFYGDPKPENFTNRVKDWMQATGDYTHLAAEVLEEPRVNISWTHYSPEMETTHLRRLKPLADAATREALPDNFDMTPEGITGSTMSRSLSPYAPFHTTPVQFWPDLIKQKGLIISHRN